MCNGEYPGMDGKIHPVKPGRHQYQNIPAWDHCAPTRRSSRFWRRTKAATSRNRWSITRSRTPSVRTDGGGLPRWEQVNRNSGGMVGDGDDAIIASAYAFGATTV